MLVRHHIWSNDLQFSSSQSDRNTSLWLYHKSSRLKLKQQNQNK